MILGTRPLGEADLLVVLLTPDGGKIRAAARHARKSRRRFAGGLPGGALGEAAVIRRCGGLARLEAFTMVRDVGVLGRDLTRFAYVGYLCELTDALVHEPEPDPRLFAALSEAVERTVAAPANPATLRRFELRLLDRLGLLPALRQCCVCGVEVQGAATFGVPFDRARGGVLCPEHQNDAPAIEAAILALARAVWDAEDPEAAEQAHDAALAEFRRGLRDLTRGLVQEQLRRPLRSLEFFSALPRRVTDDGGQ